MPTYYRIVNVEPDGTRRISRIYVTELAARRDAEYRICHKRPSDHSLTHIEKEEV